MLAYMGSYFLASYVNGVTHEKGLSAGTYFPIYLLHNMALMQGFESIFLSEQYGMYIHRSYQRVSASSIDIYKRFKNIVEIEFGYCGIYDEYKSFSKTP